MRIMQTTWTLIWQTILAYFRDRAMRMAAALAYYTAFSLAPLLLIATAIAGFFVGEQTAQGAIASQIESEIGPQAANIAEVAIRNARNLEGSWITTIISFGALLIGSTIVFLQLQDALNKVWEVPVTERGNGILSMVTKRLISFGMVMATGFLLVVSLIISASLAALGNLLSEYMIASSTIMQVINLTVSFAVIAGLFGLIFRYLPDAEITWADVWLGALVTSGLFSVGKGILGIYLGRAAPTSIYGAAGSFAVILLWVYWSTQILLFGAEFTHVYAKYRNGEIDIGQQNDAPPATPNVPESSS